LLTFCVSVVLWNCFIGRTFESGKLRICERATLLQGSLGFTVLYGLYGGMVWLQHRAMLVIAMQSRECYAAWCGISMLFSGWWAWTMFCFARRSDPDGVELSGVETMLRTITGFQYGFSEVCAMSQSELQFRVLVDACILLMLAAASLPAYMIWAGPILYYSAYLGLFIAYGMLGFFHMLAKAGWTAVYQQCQTILQV
jgi:hypothetical protein